MGKKIGRYPPRIAEIVKVALSCPHCGDRVVHVRPEKLQPFRSQTELRGVCECGAVVVMAIAIRRCRLI